MNLLDLFKQSVEMPIFEDFNVFEDEVLRVDKSKTLESVISLSLRCKDLGQAFAAGYRCALQALVPELDNQCWAAMCVTEASGNHPKQIETQLNKDGLLFGKKTFVTMATAAKQLIVIAKAGEDGDLPLLKAVLVDQIDNSQVIKIDTMPSLGMIPDINHGQLRLSGAAGVSLPGDGYIHFSKRFRTLEDIHLLCAFTGLVMSMAYRFNLPDSVLEKGMFLLNFVLNNDLIESELQHLNVHQAFLLFEEMVKELKDNESMLPADFVRDWRRDEKLFKIASKARIARQQKALVKIRA